MATSSGPESTIPQPSSSAQLVRTDSTDPQPSPTTLSLDVSLLPVPDAQPKTPRARIVSAGFTSSPLNPNAVAHSSGPPSLFSGSHPQSRQHMTFNRVASEDSQVLASQGTSLTGTSNRASMILYHIATEDGQRALSPPGFNRRSVLSNSGDSVFTVSYDSKYPSGVHTPNKLVPFPFDPSLHVTTPEDDDALHDPSVETPSTSSSSIPIRGLVNVSVLVFVILALLFLFIFYPVWSYLTHTTLP